MKSKGIFITATDTGVGKTVVTSVLGVLLQEQGVNVGAMKPVQCAGEDAAYLKEILSLKESLDEINPYYAKEPLSPHLAFARQNETVDINKIQLAYDRLATNHEVMLVEGAGGLMVPLKQNYYIADLIRDLDLEAIVVSRLGLGTINHTILTIQSLRAMGVVVQGVIFNQTEDKPGGTAEKTNPQEIERFACVPVLGIIPFLHKLDRETIYEQCRSRVGIASMCTVAKSCSADQWKYGEWDKKYVWHPFTQMQDWLNEHPVIIERARGSYLFDTQGNQYLDGTSSLWVNVHGHGHAHIDRSVKEQINRLSHSTLLGLSNTPAVTLAKRLVNMVPPGLEKVFYSDNGSTSVEIAIKMAYQYWQNTGNTTKKNIVHLENSYHGDTLGGVSVGGIDLFHRVYRDLIFKTICLDFPDGYRAPAGKQYPDYAFEHVDKLEKLLKNQNHQIAAMVVEPIVQGAAGMIVWPEGILRRMRELCAQYDVLFIADEVATGFGRTGKMFACEHEDVAPDILCLAKGLTGGYLPLAATLTTQRIFDGFCFDYKDQKAFFHGHTYTGNPLGCAAALANLDVFDQERVLEQLQPKIKYLSRELEVFYNLRHVGNVRQKGYMVGIELVRDRGTKEPYPWEDKVGVRVCQAVRKKGVILRPLGNVIVLMPPLAMAQGELKTLLEATYWAIAHVTEGKSVPKMDHAVQTR